MIKSILTKTREFTHIIRYEREYEPIYYITRGTFIYATIYRKITATRNPRTSDTEVYYQYQLRFSELRYNEISPRDKNTIEWLFSNMVNTQAQDVCDMLNSDIPERINDVLPITFKLESVNV